MPPVTANRTLKYFLWLPILLALTTSCSVKKRQYLPGFYVSWNKKKANPESVCIEKKALASKENFPHQEEAVLLASAEVKPGTELLPRSKKQLVDSCGDKIILKDDHALNDVKIMGYNSTSVFYFDCLDISQTMKTITTEKVKEIRYLSGKKEDLAKWFSDRMIIEKKLKKRISNYQILHVLLWVLFGLAVIGAIVFFSYYSASVFLAIIFSVLGATPESQFLLYTSLCLMGAIVLAFGAAMTHRKIQKLKRELRG